MSDTPLPLENFARTICNEATRISEDALFCYAGHAQEARWWEGVHLWLGIPTTIIAAITGVTSLSDTSGSSLVFGFNSSVVVGILAFIVAAMSGVSTYLDPKGQASKHYHAANAYLALLNDIRIFRKIECARGSNDDKLEDSLRKFNAKLNELNSQTIIISTRAKQIGEKLIRAGKYNYQIDKDTQKLLAS